MSLIISDITKDKDVRAVLLCPFCRQTLTGEDFACLSCGRRYATRSGMLDFLSEEEKLAADALCESDSENKIKNFVKRWPVFYRFLSFVVSPALLTGFTLKSFLGTHKNESLVLNVGSGATRLHERVINVDIFPFKNVNVLAMADKLPFRDASMDVVCSEEMLEHVRDPQAVVAEMVRVLKPGGLIYIGAPFLFPWHPSPRDYSRWSREGLSGLLSGCEIESSGVTIGPTSALLLMLCTWLSIVFSFGVPIMQKMLNYSFMLICFPLKFLDLIVARLPGAEVASAAVYAVGRKKAA